MTRLIRRLLTPFLVATLALGPATALSTGSYGSRYYGETILDTLQRTDGAQALVAAVLVVDEAGVLPFSIAELLDSVFARLVVFGPSNAAFEKLLGLDPGALDGLSIEDIEAALPGLLPMGVGAEEVAAVLLKHVAHVRFAKRQGTEDALLRKGEVQVADGSIFQVGIGASGVQVNYETTIIKPDVRAVNGYIHFVDTVIVDGLL